MKIYIIAVVVLIILYGAYSKNSFEKKRNTTVGVKKNICVFITANKSSETTLTVKSMHSAAEKPEKILFVIGDCSDDNIRALIPSEISENTLIKLKNNKISNTYGDLFSFKKIKTIKYHCCIREGTTVSKNWDKVLKKHCEKCSKIKKNKMKHVLLTASRHMSSKCGASQFGYVHSFNQHGVPEIFFKNQSMPSSHPVRTFWIGTDLVFGRSDAWPKCNKQEKKEMNYFSFSCFFRFLENF